MYLANWSLLAGYLWSQYIASSWPGFSSTQQLIHKSKIEKQNGSLDIFISDTSIARNLYLPGLEKKQFNYKTKNVHASDIEVPIFSFWIRYGCLCCSKSKNVRESRPYHRGIKISALINDWENNIAYWEETKQSEALANFML